MANESNDFRLPSGSDCAARLPQDAAAERRGYPEGVAEPPLTLADLRRTVASRRRAAPREAMPGLFDTVDTPGINSPEQNQLATVHSPAPSQNESEPIRSSQGAHGPIAVEQGPGQTSPRKASFTPPTPETRPVLWTVSGLVRHIRGLVEGGYSRITVEGEISNWRPAGSGHCYFTLKDANAQLSAVIFRRQVSLLNFQPRDGDAVKLHGQLSVFENRGQLQVVVEWMQQAGLGALLAEVQRLKERLRQEGLFDRKRPLPPFPRCIGVITSPHGAALRDIIKVCRRRHAAVQLLIYPAAVQGASAPTEIAAGLRWFNAHPDHAEVVLVARGGGSWEDLHGFDHESVARAIADCQLPVITGIGHATDTTIADAAADVCAPTPSAAAELLTAAHHRVEERLEMLGTRMQRATHFELMRARQRMGRLGTDALQRGLDRSLKRRDQRLDELHGRLRQDLLRRLRLEVQILDRVASRLSSRNPLARMAAHRTRLADLRARLERTGMRQPALARERVAGATHRLEALSPLRVLDRGYAMLYTGDGHLLRDPKEAVPGAEVRARLAGGTLRAIVLPES